MKMWYTFDEFGLVFDRKPSVEEATALTKNVADKNRLSPIEIGDLLNELEDTFQGDWTQFLSYFPEQRSNTLSNYKSITRRVPRSIRVAVKGEYPLYISDMGVVRSLPAEDQIRYLQLKTQSGWSSDEIKAKIHQDRGIIEPEPDEFADLLSKVMDTMDALFEVAPLDKKPFIRTAKDSLEECVSCHQ